MKVHFKKWSSLAAAFIILCGVVALATPTKNALAAISSNTVTDLVTYGNSFIKASSAAKAVLGLNIVVSASETLKSVRANISPETAGFLLSDLSSTSTAATTAFAVYKDNKSSGTFGNFDSADTFITPSTTPYIARPALAVRITPTASSTVSDTAMTLTAGDIVFTALGTSGYDWHMVTVGNGGSGGVAASALRLDGSESAPSYTASANFAKFTASSTAVYTINGSSNTLGLSPGDIVMSTSTGSTVNWGVVTAWSASAASIDGTALANSSYRISAVAGKGDDLTVPTSGAITSARSVPFAIGDAVIYKRSSEARYSYGIVTNATLTAGQFSIDGVPLNKDDWNVARMTGYSPVSLAITENSTTLMPGDVVLDYTTKYPQLIKNRWTSVTTQGTVSGTALRYEGSAAAPVHGYTVYYEILTGSTIPADNSGANAGADFFLAVRTSSTPQNAAAFSVGIGPGAVVYSSGFSFTTPTATNSTAVTIDTTAPTITSVVPANSATNVGINTFVEAVFSKNINPASVTSSTLQLKLTSGGTAVPATLRVGLDRITLIPSLAPTFSGSKFAQQAVSGFSYFNIPSTPGTAFIAGGGTYTTPAAGDIVYFQRGSFAPEVGIITNTTLTSGNFAINDLPLFGTVGVTLFNSATATGLVTASTVLMPGDLVIAFTTSSPTTYKYQWHIVTTGAAVNSASLRLDGESARPAYMSGSQFSMIGPTASSTVNGSGAVASLTLSVGDMIFANVSSATTTADNVGSYAWHIVSAAETISGAIPATLRLDGKSVVPTFANSSIISKKTLSASGPTDGSNTTTFTEGDVVFAKTSAGSASNDSYGFHLVTAPGIGITNGALRLDNTSTPLTVSTGYTVRITTGVTDFAGNAIASQADYAFTTSAVSGGDTAAPAIQSSMPQSGLQSFPTNYPLRVTFKGMMATSGAGSVTSATNVGLYTMSFGAPSGSPLTTTKTYDVMSRTLTVTPSSALTASTDYMLTIATSTLASNSVALSQPFRLAFKTSSGAATSTPATVLGTFPKSGTTGVSPTVPDIAIVFTKDMDPASVKTVNYVYLQPSVVATVTYDPASRTAHLFPGQALAANTTYTLTVKNNIVDLGSINLDSDAGTGGNQDYTMTFTTSGTADTTKPAIISANADNIGVAISFSKAVKADGGQNAADNLANFTLESPTGTSISLAGKTIIHDLQTMTTLISGLALQNGATFKVTASNLIQDIANNFMATTSNQNIGLGLVANSATTGGQLSPGGGTQQSAATQGMTPVSVMPASRVAGATSNYSVQFPVTATLPLGGSIVLTFPTGFDVTNAAALTAGTNSFRNSDINGPGAGTVTIASVTPNATARTVTIVTAGAATGANAFVSFDLSGIVNTTIPSTSGYTVDVRVRDTAANNNNILETKTSGPFFLGQAGSYRLTVNVFNDNGAGGGTASNNTKDGSEAGIASARVFLFSPSTGGMASTTPASGVALFDNLVAGDYMVGLDSASVASGGYVINSTAQKVSITTNTTKNFGLTASSLTIQGSLTGPASTAVDVFGSSNVGFTKTTVTLNGSGAGTYSLPVQANTTYSIGVGPSMPNTYTDPGAPPPPPPTFTFMPPPNQVVAVASTSVSGKNFTLSSAGKTISGTVVDASGNAVANAGVFARPIATSADGSSTTGFGSGGQTDSSGAFSINVVAGTYVVGVFKPGMPNVPDKQIYVPSSGSVTSPATLAFKLGTTASLTITGTVKDDSGNAVAYAGVSASKITSTSDTTVLGGNSANFVGGPADSNGAYTLYVTAGTWKLEAFAPGVGRLGSKTVTVETGTSLSGQDFSGETLSLGTVTGQALKASVAQQGVVVRVEGASGANMGTTDSTGTYSIKVPAGSSYTVNCVFPGVGDGTPVTGVTVTANTTTSGKDCTASTPITITVNVTDGISAVSNAFVDVRDTNGRGNGTNQSVTTGANAVYTVQVPAGTYTVRVGHQAYGVIGTTTGISTTQSLSYTATAGAMITVTGSVILGDGGAGLGSAWVSFNGTPTGQTNTIQLGAQTADDGTFSITIPKGLYKVNANKPGYTSGATRTITFTAATALTAFSLFTSPYAITGTVSINGSGVSGAFVDASNSNGSSGFAVAQTDSSGTYSLPVSSGTWTVRARSLGYQSTAATVEVTTGSATKDITLSAISGFTAAAQKQENVTPTSGGLFTNTDIGSAFKLNIPANALSTSANASTIKTQANTAVPNAANGTVLAKNAISISVVDSSGSPTKSLNDTVTIVMPYTPADIPTGGSASDLVIGVYNDATQTWDTLSTTVDASAQTLTAQTTHFSDFAPLLPTTVTAAASSGSSGSGSSGSSGGGGGSSGSVCITCLTNAGPVLSGTKLAQNIPAPVLVVPQPAQQQTAPAPAAQPQQVTYSFKRVMSSGATGADVTALQTFLEQRGLLTFVKGQKKGTFGTTTKKALASYQKSVGLKQTGTFDTKTRAYIQPLMAPAPEPVVAQPAPALVAFTFKRMLSSGATGADVAALQTFLESKGLLKIQKGVKKGTYGSSTKKAVAAYQKLAGLKQTGVFDSKTRAQVQAE